MEIEEDSEYLFFKIENLPDFLKKNKENNIASFIKPLKELVNINSFINLIPTLEVDVELNVLEGGGVIVSSDNVRHSVGTRIVKKINKNICANLDFNINWVPELAII